MARLPEDLTGQTFCKLTAIKYVRSVKTSGGRSTAIWLWKCFCGNEVEYSAKEVKYQQLRGAKQSCGCWYKTKKYFGEKAVANSVFIRHYNDGDLTFDDFYELSQRNCYYCGAPPANKLSHVKKKEITFIYNGIDRLDNSKGHNKSNCVSSCWICNERKSNWNEGEFLDWITQVYKHRIEEK